MAHTKIIETALPEGKAVYTSELLTSKFEELVASGDLVITNETLENGNKKSTHVWKDDAAYASFISWLTSSGELARMQQYHSDNGINPIVS